MEPSKHGASMAISKIVTGLKNKFQTCLSGLVHPEIEDCKQRDVKMEGIVSELSLKDGDGCSVGKDGT